MRTARFQAGTRRRKHAARAGQRPLVHCEEHGWQQAIPTSVSWEAEVQNPKHFKLHLYKEFDLCRECLTLLRHGAPEVHRRVQARINSTRLSEWRNVEREPETSS